MKTQFKIKGRFRLLVGGMVFEAVNQVTTLLGQKVAAALLNGNISLFRYIAVGTGTTLEASSNSALEAESTRALCVPSLLTTIFSNDTFKLSGSFTPIADIAVGELGIFDDVVAGTLGARGTFRDINNLPAPKNVVVGQLVNLEYFIQIAV